MLDSTLNNEITTTNTSTLNNKSYLSEKWQQEIDVRDFIQTHYSPYEGGPEFLAPPTSRTQKLWEQVAGLMKEERSKGILDADTKHAVCGRTGRQYPQYYAVWAGKQPHHLGYLPHEHDIAQHQYGKH